LKVTFRVSFFIIVHGVKILLRSKQISRANPHRSLYGRSQLDMRRSHTVFIDELLSCS
jgi:hypothetical protein